MSHGHAYERLVLRVVAVMDTYSQRLDTYRSRAGWCTCAQAAAFGRSKPSSMTEALTLSCSATPARYIAPNAPHSTYWPGLDHVD